MFTTFKNIQYQNRSVNYAHSDRILQVSELHPRQFIVENDGIRLHVFCHFSQFFDFSFSD